MKGFKNTQLLDDNNKNSLNEIQKSLFLVALDNPMPEYKDDSLMSLASKQFIHGGGSRANSGNRWFDKTVQVNKKMHYILLFL